MQITEKAWVEYITKMSQISQKAADLMHSWVQKNGLENDKALLDYAYALSQHYGQAIGALSCQMYEATAVAQGVIVPTAEVADLPDYGEVAKAVKGTKKQSPNNIPGTLARLVKQVGADTTLKNAERDGAQFAWVPHGDTCAFCITLASRGWQYMSKKALRNGHAEHIHAHCDCEYAVRFDGKSTVAGYDPDKYLEEYSIIPHQVLEVTTMDLLIEFAKIGLGVACVIRELVQKELDNGTLVEVPLKNAIHRRTIGFAYHSNNQAMALKTFLEFLY